MLEWLLTAWLINQISPVFMGVVGFAGLNLFTYIHTENERMEAIMNDCTIYTRNYTEYDPEWYWGEQDGTLNFHELICFPIDVMQDRWGMNLKQISRDQIQTTDYTLNLYFRGEACVMAEYYRPCDRHFCDRYGQGTMQSFHLYSECIKELGEDIPIDFEVEYNDYGNNNQMVMRVSVCGKAQPYVISNKCKVSLVDRILNALPE